MAHDDRPTAVLSGSYARTVVSRYLNSLPAGLVIVAGPAGWTVTAPSGVRHVFSSVNALAERMAAALAHRCSRDRDSIRAIVHGLAASQPPHRRQTPLLQHSRQCRGCGRNLSGAAEDRWMTEAIAEFVCVQVETALTRQNA